MKSFAVTLQRGGTKQYLASCDSVNAMNEFVLSDTGDVVGGFYSCSLINEFM